MGAISAHGKARGVALLGFFATAAITGVLHAEAAPPPAPTEAPPPEIVSSRNGLSAADLATKKEGAYLTGLPLVNYDPNFGLGLGARANLFLNGPREAELFPYVPYQQRISLTLFATTKGLQFHWLDYDAPFFDGSAFRFRAQAIFEQNVDRHYYGFGAASMDALHYPGAGAPFAKQAAYESSQSRALADGTTFSKYDRFWFRRPAALLSVERTFLGGRLRPFLGTAFSYATLRDFTGESVDATDPASGNTVSSVSRATRLHEDCDAGRIVGCNGGWDNFLRVAIAFDTRDYEPDPTSGVFVDLGADLGTRALGSRYDYARVLLTGRAYISPFPKLARLVIALRGLYQVETSDTPIFSANVLPFTEDPKTGLGGFRTLRGFSEDRFVGPVMTNWNAEIRWTLGATDLLKQHFALMLVPFVDTGRVFDSIRTTTLRGFRSDVGGGVRIAWNQATIIMFDYGVSAEASAFYINFDHIF